MKYDAVIRELTYAIREIMAAWSNRAERYNTIPHLSGRQPMSEREGMLLKSELGHLKIAKNRILDAGQVLAREQVNLDSEVRLGGALRELDELEAVEMDRFGEPVEPSEGPTRRLPVFESSIVTKVVQALEDGADRDQILRELADDGGLEFASDILAAVDRRLAWKREQEQIKEAEERLDDREDL